MERHVYDADSLLGVLRAFEEGYGFSSDEFYRAHVEDSETVQDMSGSHRQTWAGFYVERERLQKTARRNA